MAVGGVAHVADVAVGDDASPAQASDVGVQARAPQEEWTITWVNGVIMAN